MNVHFSRNGRTDYLHWTRADLIVLKRLNELIEDAGRRPFEGLGKPEPLRGDLSGYWSRRITGEHRMVYRVQGRKGDGQRVEIAQCRHHY